jgi:hypothetical protein
MRIPRVTGARFRDESYLEGAHPAIIVDALEPWRIAERWSPLYLANLLGDRKVPVSVSEDGRYDYRAAQYSANASFTTREMAFSAAVKAMLSDTSGQHFYIMQQSLPERFPELLANLTLPGCVGPHKPMQINLWLGRATVTPLHFDFANNFFAQLHGEKEFLLYAPEDSRYLYPLPPSAAMAHVSLVDVDEPDYERFAEFRQATALRLLLQPGELLFLPAFWWHHVRCADISVSVNLWTAPTLRQFVSCRNGERFLYKMYAADRLAGFRDDWLRAQNLNFVSAAALMLDNGRSWAGCVLALAGFDEILGDLRGFALSRPRGCPLDRLAEDMDRACRQLEAEGRFARFRDVIETVPLLAQQTANFADDAVSIGEVARLLECLRALPRTHHSTHGPRAGG